VTIVNKFTQQRIHRQTLSYTTEKNPSVQEDVRSPVGKGLISGDGWLSLQTVNSKTAKDQTPTIKGQTSSVETEEDAGQKIRQ
jgi:hypothetical protein